MLENFIKLTESYCSIGLTAGFSIMGLEIRWYAVSYIIGLLGGLYYIKYILKLDKIQTSISPKLIDDVFIWIMSGIILGGRLGYVLFYNLHHYLNHPIKILYIWEGGMSFHGGMIGIILSILIFSQKNKIHFLKLSDLIACAAPIGLFFGRISNFLNGELWGKPTNLPWGIIFEKCAGNLKRHPTQLYESLLEGLLIFLILLFLVKKYKILNHPGKTSGLFCILYACSRISIEFFREPDKQLGYIYENITMGILLSIPLIFIGILVIMQKDIK